MARQSIAPFQKITAIHAPSPRVWLLLGPGAYIDVLYDGENDGVRSIPTIFYNDHDVPAQVLGRYTSASAMLGALAPLARDAEEPLGKWAAGANGVAVLTWTPDTEHPTEPTDYADWQFWTGGPGSFLGLGGIDYVRGSLIGELDFFVGLGESESGGRDPNCPPFQENVQGDWATEDHRASWLAYQESLVGIGITHVSKTYHKATYDAFGVLVETSSSCEIGIGG